MSTVDEIKDVLLEICSVAALRIRTFGWRGESDQCANEANHIHNLPAMVRKFTVRELARYHEIGIPAYLAKARTPEEFFPLWERLRLCMERLASENSLFKESAA